MKNKYSKYFGKKEKVLNYACQTYQLSRPNNQCIKFLHTLPVMKQKEMVAPASLPVVIGRVGPGRDAGAT
ncbi:MAG: hypothetical protein V2A61_07325, partial [Calditrichota bacterium]